ncbi:MAG: hypothetical protein AAFV53_24580 [Myxococcota bacterium]
MTPDRFQSDLLAAAQTGRQLARFAQTMLALEDQLFQAGRRRDPPPAVRTLRLSVENLINHPSMLIGYFDGYLARTTAREALQARRPGGAVSFFTLVAAVAEAFADEMGALAARTSYDLDPNGPRVPGPERTAIIARAHVESLLHQIPKMLIDLTPDPADRLIIRNLTRAPIGDA